MLRRSRSIAPNDIVEITMLLLLFLQRLHSISVTEFQKLALIGKGAFGQVHIVRHKTDGVIYAMKTMSKEVRVICHLNSMHVVICSHCAKS